MDVASYLAMLVGGAVVALAVIVGRVAARRSGATRGVVMGAATSLVGLAVVVRLGRGPHEPVLDDIQPTGILLEPAGAFEMTPPPSGDGPWSVRDPADARVTLFVGTVPHPFRGADSEALFADGLRASGAALAPGGFIDSPLPFAPAARGVAFSAHDGVGFGWLVARPPSATTSFLCRTPTGDAATACRAMLAAVRLQTPFEGRYREHR
jgi:hypothetical protein